jgi:hypothetical protein
MFVGIGMILSYQSIQVYVLDSFTLHAASALAAVSCLRSLAGFGFPLFAPVMYERLGYGKGNTILACVSIVLGCPAYVIHTLLRHQTPVTELMHDHSYSPFLFWFYGKKIRLMSRYAHKGKPGQIQSQSQKDAPAQVQANPSKSPTDETEKDDCSSKQTSPTIAVTINRLTSSKKHLRLVMYNA